MTTNAIDQKNKIIASDSRWSIEAPGVIYFVDDTGFNKIADRVEGCLICAGDAMLIEQWRNWFAQENPDLGTKPPLQRMHGAITCRIAVSVLEKPEANALFSKGPYLRHEDHAFFSGSGAIFARDCYSVNGCSKQSVKTASENDPLTGGETKYVELATNVTNLESKHVTYQQVFDQIWSRGDQMNTTTKTITPIKDAVIIDSEATKAAMAGAYPLSAPSGEPIQEWTETEISDLDRALAKLFSKQC